MGRISQEPALRRHGASMIAEIAYFRAERLELSGNGEDQRLDRLRAEAEIDDLLGGKTEPTADKPAADGPSVAHPARRRQ